MADDCSIFINANDEIGELTSNEKRPIHEAVCLGKILCPDDDCVAKRLFFLENGIGHHFRVIHKREFSDRERNQSISICKKLHVEETTNCLEEIFEFRRKSVCTNYLINCI